MSFTNTRVAVCGRYPGKQHTEVESARRGLTGTEPVEWQQFHAATPRSFATPAGMFRRDCVGRKADV